MTKTVYALMIMLGCLGVSYANNANQSYTEVGRYQISASGDYIIDTKTGVVKTSTIGNMNKPFNDK